MKYRQLLLLAVVLTIICSLYMTWAGKTAEVSFIVPSEFQSADEIAITTEHGNEIVEITAKTLKNGKMTVSVKSVSAGNDYLMADSDTFHYLERVTVHSNGVITINTYLGYSKGSRILPISIAIFLTVLLINIHREYRSDMQRSMYRGENIMDLGFFIFFAFFLFIQFTQIISYGGVQHTVNGIINVATSFSLITLPLALIISLYVTISNVRLMINEGRNWRNMLGFLLGVMLCVTTLVPEYINLYLLRSGHTGFFNQSSVWTYVMMFFESIISLGVTYLECLLAATIIIGIKAARHVPSFDQDYIMILGCQIRDDGTLTPLLQGRADRALEFAAMQKEKTGKEVIFVPSGGKGSDEIISEGDAIANYLLQKGIPESRVIRETRSANTEENFRFSSELIRHHSGTDNVKIAYSTTNFHVFRAGLIAYEEGIKAEGIGSATRSYFWINAFIREFVAIVFNHRKTHLLLLIILTIVLAAMIALLYYAEIM